MAGNYCASAYVFMGGKAGINREELIANSIDLSADSKTQAAIIFARGLLEKCGKVSDVDVTAVRAAGFSDEEVVEFLAHVALNTFTNYFNETALTAVDFPAVDLKTVKGLIIIQKFYHLFSCLLTSRRLKKYLRMIDT